MDRISKAVIKRNPQLSRGLHKTSCHWILETIISSKLGHEQYIIATYFLYNSNIKIHSNKKHQLHI